MRLVANLVILISGVFAVSQVSAESESLSVCYNFGCKVNGDVLLTQTDTLTLGELFSDVNSANEERAQIRLAIAQLETIAARYLPTGNDVGGNFAHDMVEDGKQDCIDESTNTTTYLKFLSRQGWLRWHKVEDRVHRAPYLFDDHWAAQIRQHDTNQLYVVDSWMYDNGQPPVIQVLADWMRKRDFSE